MELYEALQFFLNNYFQKQKLSERTFQLYQNELDQFYQFLKNDETLNLIESVDQKLIDSYLNECSKNLPLTKFNTVASHLRTFFSFLKKERIIENNPTLFLKLMPVGTIIRYEDTINFLSDLNNSLIKLGKEQYKFQAVFESRKESESETFNELKRRLNRSERLLQEVIAFKNELGSNIGSDFIKELLPVVDGLEEAIAQFSLLNIKTGNPEQIGFMKKLFVINPSYPDLQQWRDGLVMVYERLMLLLKRKGVTAIKSSGQKFNPYEHIAISVEKRDDVEVDTIVKENLKGYRLGDEVIRLAEVVVAKRTTHF